MTRGVVLLGNTYEEDSFGGQELTIGIASFTTHYPLEPSCLNTHTHTHTLLVLTPILLHRLHMMSLVKAVPDGLRDRERKRTVLCKCPPVPYVPEKDPVQERVSALKDQNLKTTIGEDTTLHLSIWHSRMKEAPLMHVQSTLDAIKKCGHFKDHNEAQALYVSQKEGAK